jgi:hypothetical protein
LNRTNKVSLRQVVVRSFFFILSSCVVPLSPEAATTSQVVTVDASSDDAEQTGEYFQLSSGDLELVAQADRQMVGMRFRGIAVPPGAKVVSAYIQFQVDEVSSGSAALRMAAEAIDDAPTFSSAADVFSRASTAA